MKTLQRAMLLLMKISQPQQLSRQRPHLPLQPRQKTKLNGQFGLLTGETLELGKAKKKKISLTISCHPIICSLTNPNQKNGYPTNGLATMMTVLALAVSWTLDGNLVLVSSHPIIGHPKLNLTDPMTSQTNRYLLNGWVKRIAIQILKLLMNSYRQNYWMTIKVSSNQSGVIP